MELFVLSLSGSLVVGNDVDIEVSGLVAGERTALLVSTDPSMASPAILARGRPSSDSVAITRELPATAQTYWLQVVSAAGNTSPVVEVDVGTAPTLLVGVTASCAHEELSLTVETFGEADYLRVRLYESGLLVGEHEVDPELPAPGSIFALTELVVPAPRCTGLTWTAETVRGGPNNIDHCVVRGPDEADHADCQVI